MRMKTIRGIEFYTGSREEVLPDFTTKFPYIATSAELDRYEGRFVPWHWHQAIELFFMDMGGLCRNFIFLMCRFLRGSGEAK